MRREMFESKSYTNIQECNYVELDLTLISKRTSAQPALVFL